MGRRLLSDVEGSIDHLLLTYVTPDDYFTTYFLLSSLKEGVKVTICYDKNRRPESKGGQICRDSLMKLPSLE
jgi:hypothetical protein